MWPGAALDVVYGSCTLVIVIAGRCDGEFPQNRFHQTRHILSYMAGRVLHKKYQLWATVQFQFVVTAPHFWLWCSPKKEKRCLKPSAYSDKDVYVVDKNGRSACDSCLKSVNRKFYQINSINEFRIKHVCWGFVTIYKWLWFVTEGKEKLQKNANLCWLMFWWRRWFLLPEPCSSFLNEKTKHYGLKTMFRFSYFFCTMEMLYIDWHVVNCLPDHLFFTDVVEIDLLECEHSFNDVIHSNFWTSQLIPDIESRLKVFSLSFFRSNLAGTSSQQGKTYWPCTLC